MGNGLMEHQQRVARVKLLHRSLIVPFSGAHGTALLAAQMGPKMPICVRVTYCLGLLVVITCYYLLLGLD